MNIFINHHIINMGTRRIRTIAMMLTLLVAGLVVGCSSAPEAPAAPAAPSANLSEKEAIAITRSSESVYGSFRTKLPEDKESQQQGYLSYERFTDLTHSESASFKPSGIWQVTAKSSWAWEKYISPSWPKTSGVAVPECTIVVDDVTGTIKR